MIKGPFKINGNLILTLDDLQKHFDIIEILKKPKGLIRFLEETAPEKACKVKEIEFFPTYEFVDKITEVLNCEQYFQDSLNSIFHFSGITDQLWWKFVNSWDSKDQRISKDFIDFKDALNRRNMTSLIFEVDENRLPDAAWARLVRNTSPDDIEDSKREKFIQIQKLISSGIVSRVTVGTELPGGSILNALTGIVYRVIVGTEPDNKHPAPSNSKLKTFRENEFLDGLADLPQEIELTGQLAERVKDVFLLSAETWDSLLEAEKLPQDPSNENVESLKAFLEKFWGDRFQYVLAPGPRWEILSSIKSQLLSCYCNGIADNLMYKGKLHLLGNYEVVSYSSDSRKTQLNLRWKQDRTEKHFTSVLKECCLTCEHFRCRRKFVNKEYISYVSDVGFCGDYSSSIERFDHICHKYNYKRWWELK